MIPVRENSEVVIKFSQNISSIIHRLSIDSPLFTIINHIYIYIILHPYGGFPMVFPWFSRGAIDIRRRRGRRGRGVGHRIGAGLAKDHVLSREKTHGKTMEKPGKSMGKPWENPWENHGKRMNKGYKTSRKIWLFWQKNMVIYMKKGGSRH